jgi:hypothetical protein
VTIHICDRCDGKGYVEEDRVVPKELAPCGARITCFTTGLGTGLSVAQCEDGHEHPIATCVEPAP